jgi:hypothetical protein
VGDAGLSAIFKNKEKEVAGRIAGKNVGAGLKMLTFVLWRFAPGLDLNHPSIPQGRLGDIGT